MSRVMFEKNKKENYQFLNLREYLEYDMKISNPKFEVDIEQIMDEFIFMWFLPHILTMKIHKNAINLLMMVYKNNFGAMGGYIEPICVHCKKRKYVTSWILLPLYVQNICANIP